MQTPFTLARRARRREVFSDRVHEELFRAKLDNDGWFDVARTVHRAGIRSNVTMLYGHIETVEEKVRHLLHIRNLQDETDGFTCFVPLDFDPTKTQLAHLPVTTGYANLREIAVGRLLLDNVDHVKAFWIMITPGVAQMALWYGADDLDGTVSLLRDHPRAGDPIASAGPECGAASGSQPRCPSGAR